MMLHYITQYLSKYSIGFYKRCLASKGKRKLEKKKSTVIYTRPISSFISTSILLLHDYHKNSLLFDFSSSSLYPSEVSFVTSSVPISYNTIRHTYYHQLLTITFKFLVSCCACTQIETRARTSVPK